MARLKKNADGVARNIAVESIGGRKPDLLRGKRGDGARLPNSAVFVQVVEA